MIEMINLKNEKMKKTEILKVFNKIEKNTLDKNQLSWYVFFENLVKNIDNNDVTDENLDDLLSNLKLIFK